MSNLPPHKVFERFIADPEGYRIIRKTNDTEFELISQNWQGRPWHHDLVFTYPQQRIHSDAAIVVVTGDRASSDEEWANHLANASGAVVVTLFHVPNQPLWELTEDDLIAHTFAQFLTSGDEDWPLLLPMTKAAIRALDASQEILPELRRFVVTGASKRGWTTWLTGCVADPRVIGIASMVFDNLGFERQLEHQVSIWGDYSPMFEPYVRARVVTQKDTDLGRRLVELTDPLSQIERVTVPVLLVHGMNDPYWAVDAMRQYWEALPMPKQARLFANRGHDVAESLEAVPTVARFALDRFDVKVPPRVQFDLDEGVIEVQSTSQFDHLGGFLAKSENMRFAESVWTEVPPGYRVKMGAEDQAYFVNVRVDCAVFSSPVLVVRAGGK